MKHAHIVTATVLPGLSQALNFRLAILVCLFATRKEEGAGCVVLLPRQVAGHPHIKTRLSPSMTYYYHHYHNIRKVVLLR